MVNLTLSYSNGLLFIVFMHVNGLYQHSMHINSYHMALPIYSFDLAPILRYTMRAGEPVGRQI